MLVALIEIMPSLNKLLMARYPLVVCLLVYISVRPCWVHSQLCSPTQENTSGCKMIRDPVYIISVPRRIRIMTVLNVFVVMLRLEYSHVTVRISIVKGVVEQTANSAQFAAPGMKVIELLLPGKATAGNYSVRARGTVGKEDGGVIFDREMNIQFELKQASIFVQLSKPIYLLGQTVNFRVIPVKPNLMASYESVSITVTDPRGHLVRQWPTEQMNVGGFTEKSFDISQRPAYGTWTIAVEASSGDVSQKTFIVREYWSDMFAVKVTAPVYILSDVTHVRAQVYVYHTSAKPASGNATVTLTIVPRGQRYNYVNTSNLPPSIMKSVDYFERGKFEASFSREDILAHTRADTLAGMEFHYNVSATDWPLGYTYSGYGSTFCFEARILIKWVGDLVRTFQPDSIISVVIAVMNGDGTPITNPSQTVTFRPMVSHNDGSTTTMPDRQVVVVNGFATLDLRTKAHMRMLTFVASTNEGQVKSEMLRVYKYHSPSEVYLSVSTSTKYSRVNEYMIFHVKTNVYVPHIYYQIIAHGNILLADELSMISRQKTFSLAISRDMIPMARILVFCVHQPNHIVSDSLNFFVNGTRLNPIHIGFNRGKDFTFHTVEVNARSEPGSYAAFSAIPAELYTRGLHDGLSENQVIDELLTYDDAILGSYLHKMRLSDTEYTYHFFHSKGHGIDATSMFRMAGLVLITDAETGTLPNSESCSLLGNFPCHNGINCYTARQKCDGNYDCEDGFDESFCPVNESLPHETPPIERMSNQLPHYASSQWIWQEHWIKADGRVDFRVTPPPPPITWVVNAFSLSVEKGFGLMPYPVPVSAKRPAYMMLEAPQYVIDKEQIGLRVTVFNNWYGDDFLEVLVKLHESENYKFVHVEEFGEVDSISPRTSFGEQTTLVYLEAGEARAIYIPVLPVKWVNSKCDITVSATSFLSSDTRTVTLTMQSEGISNTFFTTYLVDLITQGLVSIPDIDLAMPQSHIRPEQREFEYIPGSGAASITLFGDVVTPGFYEPVLNSRNTVGKPYGIAEANAYNLAYNTITLKFKKAAKQLDLSELTTALKNMNTVYQRLLTFMNEDGSFRMFLHDFTPSIWLTSFVAKTLSETRAEAWEPNLIIPPKLIDKIVTWICKQQKSSGEFVPSASTYDIKMVRKSRQLITPHYNDSITLTAYVLIALSKIDMISGDVKSQLAATRRAAAHYLTEKIGLIKQSDVFQLAIATYALSLTSKNNKAFGRLNATIRNEPGKDLYWSDLEIIPTPTSIQNTVPVMEWRNDSQTDAYAVATTSYGLLASFMHGIDDRPSVSIMRWLQSMRFSVGGFLSTQDTLIAMEALWEFSQRNKNRNVFDLILKPLSTASTSSMDSSWSDTVRLTKENYTHAYIQQLPNAWGYVKMSAVGSGRAILSVASSYSVQYQWQISLPQINSFNLTVESLTWGGRNFSVMYMTACARIPNKPWTRRTRQDCTKDRHYWYNRGHRGFWKMVYNMVSGKCSSCRGAAEELVLSHHDNAGSHKSPREIQKRAGVNDRVYSNSLQKREITPERLLKEQPHFSQKVMVCVEVSELGKTRVVFIDEGAQVNAEYYRDRSLQEWLLPDNGWHYTSRSLRTGLAVMEIQVPTSYAPNGDAIRDYVTSGIIPNLKYIDFEDPIMLFYFSHLDDSNTCVSFYVERSHNIARFSQQHLMLVYDYYEPGHYNTSLYETVNLFHLDVCHACASYQCPYCPGFNSANAITLNLVAACVAWTLALVSC